MIASAKRQISPVVISTALGHDGRGIFPYTLLPGYRRLLAAVRDTGTTVFTKSATRFKRRGNFIPANPLTWKYIRQAPGYGHAQRLRPHQRRGGSLRPGYPAGLRRRASRSSPISIPNSSRARPSPSGRPWRPLRSTSGAWALISRPWNSTTPAPTPRRPLPKTWSRRSRPPGKCAASIRGCF